MKSQAKGIQLQHILSIGSIIVALLISTQSNSDPVNVPKLTVLGVLGGITLVYLINANVAKILKGHRVLISLVTAFISWLFLAGFVSSAPFSQSFYGVFGRNNGILTYSLLAVILLGVISLNTMNSITWMINGLLVVGIVNVSYCAWVLAFGDFIGWQNPYKHILGTFGNPDFISAFLGIFIAACLSLILSRDISLIRRVTLGMFSLVALYEIDKSNAIQGLVMVVLAIVIIGAHLVRARFSSTIPITLYLSLSMIAGITAVLGTLQKGPWTFLYKDSVSLRGSYWHAGLQMGLDNALTGVGPDAYGDWYRSSRPPVALIDTPGINTMSNVSHNVFIDFFAWGGFPLFLLYVSITCIGIFIIVKRFITQRTFDPIFVAIATSWICYQAQSVISINQIGLALWGWILLGLLIAYDRISRTSELEKPENRVRENLTSRKQTSETSQLFPIYVLVGAICGFLIAAPPMLSDAKWQTALKNQNLQMVENAMRASYFSPANSSKYANAVNLLLVNKFQDKAVSLATQAVEFNQNSFDSWKQLYFITEENNPLHSQALENMKRLDPRNPDVTKP